MNLFESRVSKLLGIPVKGFFDSQRQGKINEAVELYEWAMNDCKNIVRQLKERLRTSKLIEEDTFNRFPAWPYINGIPKMLNIMCTLYNKPPARYVIVDGAIDENATKLLNQYYEVSNINEACSEALRFGWLYRVARVMPFIRDDKLEFDLLLPFQMEISTYENNPYKIKELGILNERWNVQENSIERFIIVWNENEHYLLDTNLNKVPIRDGNQDDAIVSNFKNPYGIIPIGTLWLGAMDAWGDPQNKLLESFTGVSVLNVWKFYSSFYHMGGIPILTNTDINNMLKGSGNDQYKQGSPYPSSLNSKDKKLRIAPDTVLELHSDMGQPPSFNFATPQSNLEIVQKIIDWDVNKILTDYNVPKNAFNTDVTPESGYSKMVSENEAIQAREKHIQPCLAFERELFEVVKVLLEYHYGVKFPEGSTLKIDYREHKYPKSAAERAQEMDVEIKNNVKTALDYIIEDNPELTEAEAEDIYQYNIEMNKRATAQETKEISLNFDEDNIIDFPDLRQDFDFTCGASSLQGVLIYYGEDAVESELANELETTSDWGTEHYDIERVAKERGFVTDAGQLSIEEIKKHIDNKTPVIIDIQAWSEDPNVDYTTDKEDGHYVVAIGYDESNIICEDPSSIGLATLSFEELEKRWHDIDKQGNEIRNWGIAIIGLPKYFRNKQIEIG
jgi:predicted double-glycine peptidase